MFAVGDLVVYGGEGVCRVESIGPSGLRYDGGDKTYYHLAPLYRSGTVMTPVDTAVMMRPIISRDRAMELIGKYPQNAAYYVDAMFISRHLERIGDCTTNICEDVIYLELGKIVRHSRVEEPE